MTFFSSIAPAAFLEILGQGGSAVAFNWWLRAASVNNLSVVLVSDIFYSIFFGLIALVLIIRMAKNWNHALIQRVGTITVSTSTSYHDSASKTNNDDNQNDDDENSVGTMTPRAPRPPPVVDDIVVSVKEIVIVLKSHFFNNSSAIGWLVLAGTCDCILSLCETYASGHIAVITQLFLKAGEPIITWLFALKWRRSERSSAAGVVRISPSAYYDSSHHHQDEQQQQQHDEKSPLFGKATNIPVNTDDDLENSNRNNNEAANESTSYFPKLFTPISTRRMIFSLISLLCVCLGIALHFALNIRHDVEKGEHNQNPAGFVAMYVLSIFGSALYAISFGRYIFLVRRFSVHTDPLDIVDLHRGITHRRVTEHHQNINNNRSVSRERLRQQQSVKKKELIMVKHDEDNENKVNNSNDDDDVDHVDDNNHVASESFADENIQRYDGCEYNQRGSVLDSENGQNEVATKINRSVLYDDDSEQNTDNNNNNRDSSPSHRRSTKGGDTRQSIQSFATSTHSRSKKNINSSAVILAGEEGHDESSVADGDDDNNNNQKDSESEHHLAILEQNKCRYGVSATDVRVIACTLEVTIALLLSVFVAPCLELMPGGVGGATSWSDLVEQTSNGITALASKSTLLFAVVTLLGWAFVYAADSVLNHLSAPLTSLINQLASPLTAIVLMLFPILDASATPEVKKLSEFSFGLQLVMKIGSCVMVFIGSILMYIAEKRYAD